MITYYIPEYYKHSTLANYLYIQDQNHENKKGYYRRDRRQRAY